MEYISPKEYRDKRRRKQVCEAVRRYRQRYPEKVKESNRQYYLTHKEQIRRSRRERRKREKEEDDSD